MTKNIFFAFILINTICSAQTDNGIEAKYYKNKAVKYIAIKRGTDTLEFKSYYKSGKLKDSVLLYIQGHHEIPLGTAKSYYENGNISSITHYKHGNDESIAYKYGPNGQLLAFDQRPTGLRKSYKKNGEQTRELDYHHDKEIYVSKKFRKGRHLKNSGFIKRIQKKNATLVGSTKKIKLRSGVLVSLTFNSDTVPLTHCQIEGFSKDSIYLSKFNYNENYTRGSGLNILKYDSTFALGFNQLDKLYYARHKNRKRSLGAITAMAFGLDLATFPIIPFSLAISAGADPVTVAYVYAGFVAVGVPLYFYGKYLYKTMVPKRYDIRKSKILVRT